MGLDVWMWHAARTLTGLQASAVVVAGSVVVRKRVERVQLKYFVDVRNSAAT